jgi:hypothetical protein
MNQYAQSMLDMLGQVGKPIVSKQTTTSTGTSNQTQSANEGLDIGSLMMMLMLMLNKGNKKKDDEKKGYDPTTDNPWNPYADLNSTAQVMPTYAPPARDMRDIPLPSGDPGGTSRDYPGAGTGNASPDLAEALTGAVLSAYMNRNPNMMSPGSQLSTGTNPMARMTPAQLLQLMMG